MTFLLLIKRFSVQKQAHYQNHKYKDAMVHHGRLIKSFQIVSRRK